MKKWLLLLTAGVAFSVNSASLIPESGVSVLYINGEKTDSSIGQQYLESGKTEIIVRLEKDYSRGSSNNMYTSLPYVVKFSVTGEEVKLKHPTARSYQEAENAFRDNNPQWTVIEDGTEISYQQELLPPKDGLFPYLGMDKIVADYYLDKDTRDQAVVASDTGTNTTSSKATSNLVQLKAWYLKSSAEERKAFRKWIIDQE